jgi:O-methyltransferase
LRFGHSPNLKNNKSHVQNTSFAAKGGVIPTQFLNEALDMIHKIKKELLKVPSLKTYAENRTIKKRNTIPHEMFQICSQFKDFTMVQEYVYIRNLMLVNQYKNIKGCVVECGTWKGGMVAGIATLLKNQDRTYYLYDSFEGLPPAKEIDGIDALEWQKDTESAFYLDNCTADEIFAKKAMELSGVKKSVITKGWFSDTLPNFSKEGIAILRMDGDWYDSTMDCLNNLYRYIVPGGIIIIDDYYTWEGCSKAIHDFISKNNYPVRVHQFMDTVAYIVKA